MRLLFVFATLVAAQSVFAFGGIATNAKGSWTKTLGGKSTDVVGPIAVDASGFVYVAGTYANNNTNTNLVVDFNGNTLLGLTASSVATTYIAKLDPTGRQIWMKTAGGGINISVTGITLDPNGGIAVAGNYTNDTSNSNAVSDFASTALLGKASSTSSDCFVAKLDSNGNQTWIKTLGGTAFEATYAPAVDSAGNVYAIGSFTNTNGNSNSVLDFAGATLSGMSGSANSDGFVAKLASADGTQAWIVRIGGTLFDVVASAATNGTDLVVGGYFTNSPSDANSAKDFNGATLLGLTSVSTTAYIAKLNAATGSQSWLSRFGGNGSSNVSSLVLDASSNVYGYGSYYNDTSNANAMIDFAGAVILGKSASTNLSDLFLAKLNSSGTQQWIKTFGGSGTDVASGVAVDSSSNLYVGGYFQNDSVDTRGVTNFAGTQFLGNSTTNSYDGFVAKISSAGNQEWIKTMGGTGTDYVSSIAVMPNGTPFAGGRYTNSSSNPSANKDFTGLALLGKSTSSTLDAYVCKIQP